MCSAFSGAGFKFENLPIGAVVPFGRFATRWPLRAELIRKRFEEQYPLLDLDESAPVVLIARGRNVAFEVRAKQLDARCVVNVWHEDGASGVLGL